MIEVCLGESDLETARRAGSRQRAYAKAAAIAFTKLDVAEPIENLQIRAREQHDMDLVVQEEDDDDATFVLITGRPPSLQVRGWVRGWQAKVDTWKREGGYMVPAGALRGMEQIGVSLRQAKPKERKPCHYESHTAFHWKLPPDNPYTQNHDLWQCGLCHPPPWPCIWEIASPVHGPQRMYVQWRDLGGKVPLGPAVANRLTKG